MFNQQIKVPVSIVCELTDIKESRLQKDYQSLIGDACESIPLDALPLDIQEKYVSDWVLHDSIIDLDSFALSGYNNRMASTHFPIASDPAFKTFADRIRVMRKAHILFQQYSGIGKSTEILENLASDNNISYRTLSRWRNLFMKSPMINRLLDLDHIDYQYNKFKTKYGSLISDNCSNEFYEAVTYSIMIYENFNRPKVIRWIEYFCFWITKHPHTLGIMQVMSDKRIDDQDSITKAIVIIKEATLKYKDEEQTKEEATKSKYYSPLYSTVYHIAGIYNSDNEEYKFEIGEIFSDLEHRYKNIEIDYNKIKQ